VVIGLLAAIKLTPLIFLPYFLITRQWVRLLWACGGFVGFTLIGALLRPDDSWRYFTELIRDENRVGGVDSYANQSLLAWFSRLGLDSTPLWIISAVAVGVGAMWLARRWYYTGSPAAATVVVGLASVLISPVSWQHHAVWILPALVVGYHLVCESSSAARQPAYFVLASALFISLLRLPHWSRHWPTETPTWLWVPTMGSITVVVCLLLWLFVDLLRQRLPDAPRGELSPELLR
jgi:alpha-1,2-mannosyltransferase